MSYDERFPAEIAQALDALGEEDNRQMLARLVDEDVVEDEVSESEAEALNTLQRAGLATKQVHGPSDDGITGVYRLSEYGDRWMNAAFSTMGEL